MKSQIPAASLLEFGEQEHRRIARELHDDISQRLSILADDARRLSREINCTDEAIRRRLDSLAQQAGSLSEDLRRISHILHPAIVEDLGLAVAIRSLTADFAERTGLPARFVESAVPRALPNEISTPLYRIAQEALRNISQHAGETSVRLTLEAQPEGLLLVISDLGKGFDATNISGLGLISMRERAHLAGGSFALTSAPGKGTTIRVRLPIPNTPAN